MKHKILFYGLFFILSVLSCTKQVVEPTPLTPQTNVLKAASLGINYYVAPTGNDSNTGTSSSPFLTIQKAADTANAGDSVIVRDGVYTTAGTYLVYLTKSGTSIGYITFRSEHKWGAVLDGGDVSGYGILIANGASHVKFIDFEVRNFKYMGYF